MNPALKHLCKQTNTKSKDWEQLDHPASGVGTEYWYRHKENNQEAYICIDQGEVISFELGDLT